MLFGWLQAAQLIIKLLEWTLRTGYPMVPLYRTSKKNINRFLEAIQEEMTSDPRVRKALRGTMYPLAYDPDYASFALSSMYNSHNIFNLCMYSKLLLKKLYSQLQDFK